MCQKKNQNAFIIVSLVYGSADKKKKKKTDRKEYSWRETGYMRSRKVWLCFWNSYQESFLVFDSLISLLGIYLLKKPPHY